MGEVLIIVGLVVGAESLGIFPLGVHAHRTSPENGWYQSEIRSSTAQRCHSSLYPESLATLPETIAGLATRAYTKLSATDSNLSISKGIGSLVPREREDGALVGFRNAIHGLWIPRVGARSLTIRTVVRISELAAPLLNSLLYYITQTLTQVFFCFTFHSTNAKILHIIYDRKKEKIYYYRR